ncbi:MAG TPA: hypothetical protein VMV40_04980 [Acidiferrobacter sp.]|nr:hypothetical protein [Acidiferrobacter sp.]
MNAETRSENDKHRDDAKDSLTVIFDHVNSLRTVEVKAGEDETLGALWDRACAKMTEARRAVDHLQAADGQDLTPYLALTLLKLQEKLGIKIHKIEIVGPTGGA